MTLEEEEGRLNQLLGAKSVSRIFRPRGQEVIIEFSDKTRLFVNSDLEDLDLSVTSEGQG
ncbi:MAG: hypothetical protein CMF75_01760 [Maricaulis sp.]|nr:hypothetical protein [Maricaulis sp.]